MGNNVVELDGVYLEFPEDMENIKVDNKPSEVDMVEEIPIQTEEEKQKTIIVESRTTKLSLEELQRKLEETQALHL